jgi:hypothetical protein
VSQIHKLHPVIPAEFPVIWRDALVSQLAPSERVLASMPLDLDTHLHFVTGILVVTNRRLLARQHAESDWQGWDYRVGLVLHRRDHAGVGSLDLDDADGRLASWHYTLAHNTAAQRLQAEFDVVMAAAMSGEEAVRHHLAVCVNCHAPLPEGEEECPICEQTAQSAPSTWALLRLWRFAQPYNGLLLLGFLLTLGATAATLVPPY